MAAQNYVRDIELLDDGFDISLSLMDSACASKQGIIAVVTALDSTEE